MCVYWASENPKVTIDADVNLTGVCVGPFFFDGTVTAQSYLAMQQQQLLLLLQQQGGVDGL